MRKLWILTGSLISVIGLQALIYSVLLPALSQPGASNGMASAVRVIPALATWIALILAFIMAFLCALSVFLFVGTIVTFALAALITVPASGR